MILNVALEVIAAWASIIIACCALGLTIWQARITRKHNRLSVTPLLNVTKSRSMDDDEPYFALKLRNQGTGPAVIKSYSLLYKGKEVPVDKSTKYIDFIESLSKEFEFKYSRLGAGYPIASGQEIRLLSIYLSELDSDIKNTVDEFARDIKVSIEYHSIYEDKVFVCKTRP